MRARGVSIKKDYLRFDLYSYKIPPAILKGLNLKCPGELVESRRAKSIATGATIQRETITSGLNTDFAQINI